MEVSYYVKDHGEKIEDATTTQVRPFGAGHHEDIACEVAEYAWDHNDGWEWMNTGSVVFSLVLDGKDVGDFEITVDYDPVFHARKQPPQTPSQAIDKLVKESE